MKGIVIDCKTGEARAVDDGLPMIKVTPLALPQGVDREKVAETIKKVDELDGRLKALEANRVL